MTDRNRTTGARIARLPLAVVLVVATLVGLSGTTSAAPSKQDVEAAQARLDQLNEQQSLLDEQYNQARVALDAAQRRLAGARSQARSADARATTTRRELSRRVHLAYEGAGTQIGVLLGASDLNEFSDRLEFLNQIASSDADAVTRANVAAQQAGWAERQLRDAVDQREAAFASVRDKRDRLDRMVGEQQSLLATLQRELADAEAKAAAARAEAARRAAERAQQQAQPSPSPVDTGTGPTGDPTTNPPTTQPPTTAPPTTTPPPPPPPPPPNATAAQIAISAAKSVLGVPYQYGGASPETGFDCSGLTMWSYAHAGISLPHSSAMQYASLPHVSQADLQPGDLLFFYSPIHHVAIYLGGGMMIHAPHTGAYVEIASVYWQYFVGAARPT
jgi:peptidoglycan DL-endopeptidase CwlO